MRTQRKKYSRLWVYLLYLGLVTSLVLSVSLARYASSAAGTGAATVAAVAGGADVVRPDPIEMPLEGFVPGSVTTLPFQVVNFAGGAVSEVALDYDITVNTTGNLPLEFKLASEPADAGATVPGGDPIQAGQPLTGGAFPLGNAGAPQQQTHRYTLTVLWPEHIRDAGYADEIDLVTITVTAQQRLA